MTEAVLSPTLHFSHANGFPARTYTYLFDLLQPLKVGYINTIGVAEAHPNSYHQRPTLHWASLTDELINYLSHHYQDPIIGIGHSMGGVISFMAALRRPDLFKKLIILDPPLFSPRKRLLMAIAYHLGITQYFPPASKAKRRRQYFESPQEAADYFSPKPFFKNFHPKVFESYLNHALTHRPSTNGNYTLTIPANFEYQIFCTTPYQLPDHTPVVPTTFVYGTTSDVLNNEDVAWLCKKYAFNKIIPFDGGHLFPFEQPQKTAELIQQLILD